MKMATSVLIRQTRQYETDEREIIFQRRTHHTGSLLYIVIVCALLS